MSEGVRPTGNQPTHTYTQPTQSNLNPQEQKVQATIHPQHTETPSKIGFRALQKTGDTTATRFIGGERKLFSAFITSIKSQR
ncbi:MAG: hypothetical protein S4CHLAM123_11860 [Chlamydiales bacterium]|nr:hypothetical protein [Chlamydiales bacterium]